MNNCSPLEMKKRSELIEMEEQLRRCHINDNYIYCIISLEQRIFLENSTGYHRLNRKGILSRKKSYGSNEQHRISEDLPRSWLLTYARNPAIVTIDLKFFVGHPKGVLVWSSDGTGALSVFSIFASRRATLFSISGDGNDRAVSPPPPPPLCIAHWRGRLTTQTMDMPIFMVVCIHSAIENEKWNENCIADWAQAENNGAF